MSRPRLRQSVLFLLLISVLVASPGRPSTSEMPHAAFTGWDPITREELDLKHLPEDPEADAAFVFDKGKILIPRDGLSGEPRFSLVYVRYRRLKVLKESGRRHGRIAIHCGGHAEIRNVKARTITPDGRDRWLKASDMHYSDEGHGKRVEFTMPIVQVGAILEYRYEIHSRLCDGRTCRMNLDPWDFQNPAFTRLSTLSMFVPYDLTYSTKLQNAPDPQVTYLQKEGLPDEYGGRAITECMWRLRDLPPVLEEPHAGSRRDRFISLRCCLASYRIGNRLMDFGHTWEDHSLRLQGLYWNHYYEGGAGEKWVSEHLTHDLSELERATAAYNHVRDEIRTLDGRSLSDPWEPKKVAQIGEGESIAKNLYLVNLLRHAGFDAKALLISTRGHGEFIPEWVQPCQFNDLIAVAPVDGDVYFLDASNPFCPFGVLPPEKSAGQGLVIWDDGELLEVAGQAMRNSARARMNISFTEEGDLIAECELQYTGYEAMERRQAVASIGEDDFVLATFAEWLGGAELEACETSGREASTDPLVIRAQLRWRGVFPLELDRLDLRLPSLTITGTNPFQARRRMWPVDFDYEWNCLEEITITVSGEYQIERLPAQISRGSADVSFTATARPSDTGAVITREMLMRKARYDVEEYQTLRDVFGGAAASAVDLVVIKRGRR